MVDAVTRGGGEFVAYYVREPELRAEFTQRYPNVKAVADERDMLEDNSIQLVLSSIIPIERAPLGIRVMQHGKDYMADKPGITTLDQLAEVRRVQAATKRIYSILYSERFENRGDGEGGRAREGRRDRHRHPDRRTRPAPHQSADPARVVLGR